MGIVRGTAGPDRLIGTSGIDRILGYQGDDRLFGGAGNDTLLGGPGRDLLDGGAGRDTASFATSATRLSISLGGISLARGPAQPVREDGSVEVPGMMLPPERLRSIENVIAGPMDDLIHGNEADNTLIGGAGADTIFGHEGGDVIDGGTGPDVIYGEDREYALNGGYLNGDWVFASLARPDTVRYDWATVAITAVEDYLYDFRVVRLAGQPRETDRLYGIENIWGGSGDDVIDGFPSGSELRGGPGNDTLRGHIGDDVLWGQSGRDTLDGGAGSDTAVYSEVTGPVRVDLRKGEVSFPGGGMPGEKLVSIENAVTGGGNDILIGTSADNTFDGGPGADAIYGGPGNDTVSFASHHSGVTVDLAAQRATVNGRGVVDRLGSIENAIGGGGHDVISGDAAANVLDGGAGDDVLRGRGGDDILELSGGDDVLDGGAGTDTLRWTPSHADFGDLLYSHYIDSQGTIEESETYAGTTGMHAFIDLERGIAVKAYVDTGVSTVRNIERVETGAGNDHVYGSDAAERISVGHGANRVDGRGGDDIIFGSNVTLDDEAYHYTFTDRRDAEEQLHGGAGNDRIVGGSRMFGDDGDDLLVAGWGANVMAGGAGADRFIFSDYFEIDGFFYYDAEVQRGEIVDFNAAEGDMVLIRRIDKSAAVPTFAGSVGDELDLKVGEYGFVDDTLYIPFDIVDDFGTRRSFGLEIVGDFTESDVLFV